jgi:diguanylate cyclase (GGDEF)-like protein
VVRVGVLSRASRSQPPAVAVLELITLASAVLSLLAAAYPLSPDSPAGLDLGIGLYALTVTIGLARAGDRTPTWALHGVLLSAVGCVSLVIAVSATEYGALATAFAYVWMGLYASYFFPARQASAYLALIAGGSFLALAVNPRPMHVTTWLLVISTVLGSSGMLAHLLDRLRRLADTDQLTGLLNRRGLRSAAMPMLAAAARHYLPLTLVAIDLNDFKQVNDTAGHQAGDDLLTGLADAWRRRLRRGDLLGRHGGDEFVMVLHGGEQEARTLLTALREAHPASWSAGIAELQADESFDALLLRADRSLYDEKLHRAETRA